MHPNHVRCYEAMGGERVNRGLERARRRRSLWSVLGLVVALVVAIAGCNAKGAPSGGARATDQRPGSTSAVPPATLGSDVGIRFYPQAIVDPAAENSVAFTFLVPDGWSYDGGVEWIPAWSRAAFLRTRVSDPGTGTTVDFLPIQDFIWFPAPGGVSAPVGGNYQGKMYVPPVTDPVQFVHDFWMPGPLAHLQNATLVSVTNVPQIADEFKTGFGGPADAGAWRLRYAFDQDGQPWEEDVSLALLWSGTADLTSWYVNFAWTVRAPRGVLDQVAGITSTIIASRQTTPEWESVLRWVQAEFRRGIQQQMADTVAFGRTLAQHRAETQALQAQVVAERQASEDRIADLRRQTLGGVETYDDPFTGSPVELPLGYSTYWVNDRGQYISSDQPGFDPNSLNDGFWQQLQRRP